MAEMNGSHRVAAVTPTEQQHGGGGSSTGASPRSSSSKPRRRRKTYVFTYHANLAKVCFMLFCIEKSQTIFVPTLFPFFSVLARAALPCRRNGSKKSWKDVPPVTFIVIFVAVHDGSDTCLPWCRIPMDLPLLSQVPVGPFVYLSHVRPRVVCSSVP